jgi:hypothetical protein
MDGENVPAHENLEGEKKTRGAGHSSSEGDLKVTLRHGGTGCLANRRIMIRTWSSMTRVPVQQVVISGTDIETRQGRILSGACTLLLLSW